jgi:hypothetical protein
MEVSSTKESHISWKRLFALLTVLGYTCLTLGHVSEEIAQDSRKRRGQCKKRTVLEEGTEWRISGQRVGSGR